MERERSWWYVFIRFKTNKTVKIPSEPYQSVLRGNYFRKPT